MINLKPLMYIQGHNVILSHRISEKKNCTFEKYVLRIR